MGGAASSDFRDFHETTPPSAGESAVAANALLEIFGAARAVSTTSSEDDDGAAVVLARDGARDDADEAASKLAPTPSLEFGGDADLGPPPPLVADAWTFGEGARVPAVDVDSAGSAVDDVNFLEGMHNYEADDADEAESETVPTLRLEFGDEGDDANDADSEAAPTPRVR